MHSLSGSFAIVLENSRKILHSTARFWTPSPHVTLQDPQSPTMKLGSDPGDWFCGLEKMLKGGKLWGGASSCDPYSLPERERQPIGVPLEKFLFAFSS